MNNTEAGAPALDRITPPQGERITAGPDGLIVPDHPVIPVIEGDGIGRDIMRATRTILDAAVEKSYEGRRKIAWFDVYAGDGLEIFVQAGNHVAKVGISIDANNVVAFNPLINLC
ncbi:MAG: isocitrate/isopropylmalate family dehydrogenase, partial [Gemmatimonadota bacterium]|nr:isocitrate/isopropylmalate family dehydrogenase [Gemmatimonadota bacterium]